LANQFIPARSDFELKLRIMCKPFFEGVFAFIESRHVAVPNC
jgi:hypothetical protein